MSYQRTVEDIAETLQNAKTRGKGCALLIGAGCSVKAGIPSAGGFVEVIKERYPRAYQRAPDKSYPKCMAELLLSERRDLIAEYVDRAKINWAHICIARLIQAGYVDRVLTTNFDRLILRACGLLGEFPAVYDFAASQLFKAADIPDDAVIYLHGQRTGFVLINTLDDFDRHSKMLGPVFKDAGSGRVWIVVGYSGQNDPVFEHLAEVPRFDNGLFWIGYQDHEPAEHVRERLLDSDKDAFYTNGFDADSFFVTLTQQLGIFPPTLVARPFSYLDRALATLTPYTLPGQESEEDVTRAPRRWIASAIEQYEQEAAPAAALEEAKTSDAEEQSTSAIIEAQRHLMAGDYEAVTAFRQHYDQAPSPELANALSWAYVMEGNALLKQARTMPGAEAEQFLDQAIEKFESAHEIKPVMPQALYNWGVALREQVKSRPKAEAEQLLAQAAEKFEAALKLNPDEPEALNNWGNALGEQALIKGGAEAEQLLAQAARKFETVLKLKPDKHEAQHNWGVALLKQAQAKTGPEAEHLFAQAIEKFQAALDIDPKLPDALDNWGYALMEQARTKTGSQAGRLLAQAQEKFLKAEEIQPGTSSYNLARLSALQGDKSGARQWLEQSRQRDRLPDREQLLNDPDLESVRDSGWFKQLADQAAPQ